MRAHGRIRNVTRDNLVSFVIITTIKPEIVMISLTIATMLLFIAVFVFTLISGCSENFDTNLSEAKLIELALEKPFSSNLYFSIAFSNCSRSKGFSRYDIPLVSNASSVY